MIVNILKSCSVKLDEVVQSLSPGARLHLPDDKAQRLISAGYATDVKPDIEAYRRLTRELTAQDPRGACWDWILEHTPEMWAEFLQAFTGENIPGARKLFSDMVSAWENRAESNDKGGISPKGR